MNDLEGFKLEILAFCNQLKVFPCYAYLGKTYLKLMQEGVEFIEEIRKKEGWKCGLEEEVIEYQLEVIVRSWEIIQEYLDNGNSLDENCFSQFADTEQLKSVRKRELIENEDMHDRCRLAYFMMYKGLGSVDADAFSIVREYIPEDELEELMDL